MPDTRPSRLLGQCRDQAPGLAAGLGIGAGACLLSGLVAGAAAIGLAGLWLAAAAGAAFLLAALRDGTAAPKADAAETPAPASPPSAAQEGSPPAATRPGAAAPGAPGTAPAGTRVALGIALFPMPGSGAPPPEALDLAIGRCEATLRAVLRGHDEVRRSGPDGLLALLRVTVRPDTETLMQLAARLHAALLATLREDPSLALAIGLASEQDVAAGAPAGGTADGEAVSDAARTALAAARAAGPGAIRLYTGDMARARQRRADLDAAFPAALANGEIQPWFQPQLCTDTGQVSGAEALVRWLRPGDGVIGPADILPLAGAAGLTGQLTDTVVVAALRALVAWDRAGLDVPSVAVNLSQADLDDPYLADRLLWQLDRFDLVPARLTVEILESVIAGETGDAPARNIAALATAGCGIDLDDFGTGHASITSLRRFPVRRLKIDRSFVSRVDADPVQQQMVGAILTMAERLGLGTVAEGVETAAEHARLSELGCDHVQGYGIARPMPAADMHAWLARHRARIPPIPDLGRRSG